MSKSNIALIGFMGTGKTTVGKLLADKLGFQFHDSDAIIEERAGCTVAELFARDGVDAFRKLEREVIEELTAKQNVVIATGGGSVMDQTNVERLRSGCHVALLTSDSEEIIRRIADTDTRPLLKSTLTPYETINRLLRERDEAYIRASHICCETTGRTPDEIADELFKWFNKIKYNQLVSVSLGARSYPIHIGGGIIGSGQAAGWIMESAPCRRACIVTHPKLRSYSDPILADLRKQGVEVTTITIPAGERFKTLRTVESLYKGFMSAGLDRKSVIIAVGGGVLGDIAGFAAATYMRGIRFVQVPTTLLAQVDASVGGKTGVDLAAGKNLVGAFHQPQAVLIDTSTLKTLPLREVRSGLAEIIKYGIIYDKIFFNEINASISAILRRSESHLVSAIVLSCQIKAAVISQDETEQGLRAILNFGHTVGHALEAVTHYRRFKHGEAISIGMVSASLIGEVLGVTPTEVTQAIRETLLKAGLPILFPKDITISSVITAMQHDKKTEVGKLRFVLAREIGSVFLYDDVPTQAIEAALVRQSEG